jgi:hypothetical protein
MTHKNHFKFIVVFFAVFLPGGTVCSAQSPGPATPLTVSVPFVGCRSGGQTGPLAAPAGGARKLHILLAAALKLAWYQAKNGPGVLAPRGWNCFSTYGSSGSTLYVTPDSIDAMTILSPKWKGFAGNAIQVSVADGETSGRFEVARVIARVFPKHRAFVDNVIEEKTEPATDFPSGPYPYDKLTYRNDETVEYVTPAGMKGLGTDSKLLPNAEPIEGVAMLTGEDMNLVLLSARVPRDEIDLIDPTVLEVERETNVGEPE